MKTVQTPELVKAWTEAIDTQRVKELTEWEEGFMFSIRVKVASGRDLTQPQFETLEKIYAEKTA